MSLSSAYTTNFRCRIRTAIIKPASPPRILAALIVVADGIGCFLENVHNHAVLLSRCRAHLELPDCSEHPNKLPLFVKLGLVLPHTP